MNYPKIFLGDRFEREGLGSCIVTTGLDPKLKDVLKSKKYNKLTYCLTVTYEEKLHWQQYMNTTFAEDKKFRKI